MENIQDMPYGKTSQGHLAVMGERISEPSSRKLPVLKSRYQYLQISGNQPVQWQVMDGPLPGESWMPNTGESPNAAVESTLSQILAGGVLQKYSLTEKACQGILRRVDMKGRTLPPVLEIALRVQSGMPWKTTPNDSRVKLMDDPGKCQTLTSHMGTGGGNVPLVLASGQANAELYEGLCPTLTCLKEVPILADFPYQLRRLTPLECCRLQGFPDDWCQGLINENPTDEEIQFWMKIFKDFGTPKTENYIRRWLAKPHAESAEYKMWGNGLALPCAEFVLKGIAKMEE